MASTVKLFGHTFPTWAVWASAIGGTGAVFLAYRAHKNAVANAASAATAGSAIDPVTGLPTSEDSSIDPLTNMTYLQEAQQYGSVAAADAAATQSAAGTAYGLDNESYAESGLAAGESEPDFFSSTPSSTYSTNAEWVAAVTAGMEALGYSAADVNSSLANYLAGLPLTSTQATCVQAAVAEFGPPPVGTYAINVQSTAAGATTTGTTAATTGTTTATATATATSTISAGHVVSVDNNDAVVAWSHAGPATSWKLTITGPGAINGHTATVTIPQGTYSGLESGHDYEVNVQPLPTGTAGVIAFKTK